VSGADVGTAFVRVLPLTTGFTALLQAQVNAAVAAVKVPPVIATVNTVAGSVGANSGAAAAASNKNLKSVEQSGKQAAKGLLSARQENNLLQGSLIGLSRITPVAVFGLGLIGTAAIGAGLAIKGSINAAASLQQQLDTFQAVTGSSASQLGAVSALAQQLGADLTLPATSAGDAATALTELAKAGLSVEDAMNAARGVLQLSAAANVSAGDAAKIAATQLNAFGLAGDQASKVTDLLAGASIAAQGEITDFAASFQQVSAVANQINLPIEQTAALLTQLAKAGLRGADGGTSLRTTLLRLVPTTKEAAAFQKSLGIELNNNVSVGAQLPDLIEQYRTALLRLQPVARQESLTQIFGQDAIRAASIIFAQQPRELQRLTDQLSEAGSAARLAEARMKGFSGSVEGLKSQAQTLGTTLAQNVLPALVSGVHVLSDITGAASEAAKAIKPLADITIQPLVGAVGGGDAAAQVAFAAAVGFGLKKLIERRAVLKLAAKEAVVAAKVVAVTATEAAAAQVSGQLKATVAVNQTTLAVTRLNEAYIKSVFVAGEAAVGQVAAARKAATGIIAANKGLIAGVAAAVAGSQLSNQGGGVGQAGSILAGAGAGAIAGSFIPIPGATLVGATAGAAIASMSVVVAEGKRNRKIIQDKFNSLSFEDQQAFLATLGQGERNALGGSLTRRNPGDEFLDAAGFIAKNNLVPKSDPFAPSTSAAINATALPVPTRTFIGGRVNQSVEAIAKFLKARSVALKNTSQEAALTRQSQLELNLALARLSGSTGKVDAALKAQAAFDRNLIETLEKRLVAPNKDLSGFAFSLKERTAIAKAIGVAAADLSSVLAELAQDAATPFALPASLTISGIRAGATTGLADNLAAAQAVVAAYENELANTRATGSELDNLRVKLAEAQATVVGIQQQISDQAVADKEKQIQILKDQAAAQEQLRQTILDIQLQSSDNRISRASGTTRTSDDKREFNIRIKILDTERDRFAAIARAAKKGSQKALDATLEVKRLDGQIIAIRTQIKNLGKSTGGGDSGGFTLSQLFQEAADQFNTFGSNIAGRNGVLSGQDARGALGQTVKALNPTLPVLDATLSESEKQTAYLATIAAMISRGATTVPAPITGNRGRIGSLTAIDATKAAAVFGY